MVSSQLSLHQSQFGPRIGDYPAIRAGESHKTVPNHTAMELSELNLKRIRHTTADGGDRRSWPGELWLECHRKTTVGHTDVYGRMFWDRPAPALTCRCVSLSNGRYGHPSQNRAISLREAAALQTFPDHFVFHGTMQQIAHQIGNAVPVAFATVFGELFLRLSRGITTS